MAPAPRQRSSRERHETDVRRLREQAGLTMMQLAVRAEVSETTLRRLEQATDEDELGSLWVGSLLRVADALGVRPWQLWARLG